MIDAKNMSAINIPKAPVYAGYNIISVIDKYPAGDINKERAEFLTRQINENFEVKKSRIFHRKSGKLAFSDHGDHLSTNENNAIISVAMLMLAELKEWNTTAITGSEDFYFSAMDYSIAEQRNLNTWYK